MTNSSIIQSQFNPQNYPLGAWWDASNPAANGVLPSNSTSLSSFVDLSGNGNTLGQATGANQPVFKTNISNGLPGLLFTPANTSYMTGTTNNFAVGTNPRTSFWAIKYTTVLVQQYVFYLGNSSSIGNAWSGGNFNNGGANQLVLLDPSGSFVVGNSVLFNNTLCAVVVSWSAGNSNTSIMTLNGLIQTLGGAGGVVDTASGSDFFLGARNNLGTPILPFDGYVHEIGHINSALTNAQISLLSQYLINKWS